MPDCGSYSSNKGVINIIFPYKVLKKQQIYSNIALEVDLPVY